MESTVMWFFFLILLPNFKNSLTAMAKIILSFHTSLENHVPSLFFGFMDGYLVVAGISPDSEAGEICLYMA